VNLLGAGCRTVNPAVAAAIIAATGAESSTSAPPASQRSTLRRRASGVDGTLTGMRASMVRIGTGANVITGSSTVSDAARPGRRTA
jgi:hypothetical protein